MSPRLLVELKHEITLPVTMIIRSSLESGVVPDAWKSAYVTPVYKKAVNLRFTIIVRLA